MAKMTKSAVLSTLSAKTGISKKQAGQVVDELVSLACKEAKKSGQFAVPGLGKLVLSSRPARQMIMRFGPKAGQTIDVPAKKVVKFRVAKQAKVAILGK
jgi:DNA-binding protein HU-beta